MMQQKENRSQKNMNSCDSQIKARSIENECLKQKNENSKQTSKIEESSFSPKYQNDCHPNNLERNGKNSSNIKTSPKSEDSNNSLKSHLIQHCGEIEDILKENTLTFSHNFNRNYEKRCNESLTDNYSTDFENFDPRFSHRFQHNLVNNLLHNKKEKHRRYFCNETGSV